MTTDTEVIYHGNHRGSAGPGTVEVIEDGKVTGLLAHVVRHSPTGFSWGYGGSGPADLARSLLLAALGDKAKCPTCAGTRTIAWLRPEVYEHGDPNIPEADPGPVPFDYYPADRIDPDTVCRCYDCDDGYRRLPYQDFKFAVVAGWPDEWQISRAEILAWLTENHPGFLPQAEEGQADE